MTRLRPDLQIIADNIAPGSRVLDIGCGDGALMAVLSQTLQTTRRPDIMLDQLLRIGRQAFVSFPNFAHWRIRMSLLLRGRMPVTRLIPQSWYDTPNIHHVTIEDFRALVESGRYVQEGQWFLSGDKQTSEAAANLLAEHAVFLLRG